MSEALQRCRSNGKPGFKCCPTGKCYTYTPGDKTSREQAKRKAEKQRRTINSNQRKDKR